MPFTCNRNQIRHAIKISIYLWLESHTYWMS